jgi:mannose-1-phosphate guanylyltransferase
MALWAVVLAGGSGTRFWPLSREKRPKQMLALTGRRALVAETVERLSPLVAPDRVRISCGRPHLRALQRLLPELPAGAFIVEPAPRNTGPAAALAAAVLRREDPDATILLLPSDHHVAQPDAFRAALASAAELAARGHIATLGLRPTRPETGYGYIERGEPLDDAAGRATYRAARFVEKPPYERAVEMVAQGSYLWNAGIFAFRADALLGEMERHFPDAARAAARRVPGRAYAALQSISLDYAIAERSDKVAVVPAAFGWSDVGSFASLPEVRAGDVDGNVFEGRALLLGSRDCVVLAGDRPVAVVGATGLVVVDAGDALLVVPRERAQDVRKVSQALREMGLKKYT